MIVLYRVENRAVERIRVFSEDCQLDAGGRPVRWLENVGPADSIALLESFVAAQGDVRNRVTDGAINAIAMHGDPAADASLDRLVAQNQPESVRKKVTFWLGNARGRHGFETLQPCPSRRSRASRCGRAPSSDCPRARSRNRSMR